jgi:hypothetical protein
MEILQLSWSRRYQLLPAVTRHLNFQLNCSANCLEDNSLARTTQKIYSNSRGADHIENTFLLLLHACCGLCLATTPVYRVTAWQRVYMPNILGQNVFTREVISERSMLR